MKTSSIKKKFTVLILATLLPLLLFLVFNVVYSTKLVLDKVTEASRSTVSFYVRQLDERLLNIQDYLLNTIVFSNDLVKMRSGEGDEPFWGRYNLYTKLNQDLPLYAADYFFIYVPESDRFVMAYNGNISYGEAEAIRRYIRETSALEKTSKSWGVSPLNGEDYLRQIYWERDFCLGALIKTETLSASMGAENEGARLFVTDADGSPPSGGEFLAEENITLSLAERDYYLSGRGGETIVLWEPSKNGAYLLWETFPRGDILEMLDKGQYLILLCTLFAILMFPLFVYLLYRWILRPLLNLRRGIGQLTEGNLSYRVDSGSAPAEFQEIDSAFNDMASQISSLKIQVYEETIGKQQAELGFRQAELNFLQMQMRPHFFLNALTTITNFARLHQYDSMYEFLNYLSSYIRYSLRRNISMVTVRDELRHIENYMAIQSVQHRDTFFYYADADERLLSQQIPPFLLYTFVENSVKHAQSPEKPLTLFIRISREMGKIQIVVEDDGPGYTQEYLQKLRDPDWVNSPSQHHVGIRNVKKTLQLLYGDQAQLLLSNSELSGAKATVLLPLGQTAESEGRAPEPETQSGAEEAEK